MPAPPVWMRHLPSTPHVPSLAIDHHQQSLTAAAAAPPHTHTHALASPQMVGREDEYAGRERVIADLQQRLASETRRANRAHKAAGELKEWGTSLLQVQRARQNGGGGGGGDGGEDRGVNGVGVGRGEGAAGVPRAVLNDSFVNRGFAFLENIDRAMTTDEASVGPLAQRIKRMIKFFVINLDRRPDKVRGREVHVLGLVYGCGRRGRRGRRVFLSWQQPFFYPRLPATLPTRACGGVQRMVTIQHTHTHTHTHALFNRTRPPMCIIALARCLCMMDMCMNDARPDPTPCSALLCTGRQQHTPLSVLPTFSPVPFSPSRRRLVGVSSLHIYPHLPIFIRLHSHPS